MEIVLINEELFRENSPIKDDTIITKFIPYLWIAQRIYIERILGEPLADELKEQVKEASRPGATGDEITPANQALIRALAPALSFYAVYQGIPFHWAAIVNKGVTIRASENSQAVGIDDIAQLRRWLRDDAESLARDLVEYLSRCRDRYPYWRPETGCGCDGGTTGGSSRVPIDAGIFVPKKR